MPALNKVVIEGHLGRDPEVKHLSSGTALTTMSVAVTESWKDKKTGDKKEQTEWFNVVKFGELAAVVLSKGDAVHIEGKLRTRSYEKDGIKRYITEIMAFSIDKIDTSGFRKKEAPRLEQQDDDGIPF